MMAGFRHYHRRQAYRADESLAYNTQARQCPMRGVGVLTLLLLGMCAIAVLGVQAVGTARSELGSHPNTHEVQHMCAPKHANTHVAVSTCTHVRTHSSTVHARTLEHREHSCNHTRRRLRARAHTDADAHGITDPELHRTLRTRPHHRRMVYVNLFCCRVWPR